MPVSSVNVGDAGVPVFSKKRGSRLSTETSRSRSPSPSRSPSAMRELPVEVTPFIGLAAPVSSTKAAVLTVPVFSRKRTDAASLKKTSASPSLSRSPVAMERTLVSDNPSKGSEPPDCRENIGAEAVPRLAKYVTAVAECEIASRSPSLSRSTKFKVAGFRPSKGFAAPVRCTRLIDVAVPVFS